MEIGIKVITEDIRRQIVRHANSCYFTMVAVSQDRKPQAVPPLVPQTPEQAARFEQAKARKAARLALHGAKNKGQ
jgi:acyl-CoA hydrolase